MGRLFSFLVLRRRKAALRLIPLYTTRPPWRPIRGRDGVVTGWLPPERPR